MYIKRSQDINMKDFFVIYLSYRKTVEINILGYTIYSSKSGLMLSTNRKQEDKFNQEKRSKQ